MYIFSSRKVVNNMCDPFRNDPRPSKNASVANKQTSTIFVGAHTSEQNTLFSLHFHFFYTQFMSLIFYTSTACTASQPNLYATEVVALHWSVKA